MLGRLVGQETEYAIRFSPERKRPGNQVIFAALAQAIESTVRTGPGAVVERSQIFTQNGGAFYYESLPYRVEGGLIEGATPECRGPLQLLLYQRAQEALLLKVIPKAEATLSLLGYPGTLGLLKNCRDAEGHVYGAQESFQVTLASGAWLLLYRLGLALLLPVLLATTLSFGVLLAVVLAAGFVTALLSAAAFTVTPLRHTRWGKRFNDLEEHAVENVLGRVLYWLFLVLSWPFTIPFSFIVRTCAFRGVRRNALAFLMTRSVFSGAGTVGMDGNFELSEKAAAINGTVRWTVSPNDRPVFDIGNLMKAGILLAHLHFAPLLRLFSGKQRLQLGLADSNRLQEPEYVKFGATSLVIDMIESGFLKKAPRLRRPVRALHEISGDPTLEAVHRTSMGPMRALEIQRFYLEQAKAYLRDVKTTTMEASNVVRLWGELLTKLEKGSMDELVGRLDWVTKRFLLETSGAEGGGYLLKTIDLRYHELGSGYADRFERAGHTSRLVEDAAIEAAIYDPPRETPAYLRGRFVRQQPVLRRPVRVSWGSAVIGGRVRGKVIRFEPKKK